MKICRHCKYYNAVSSDPETKCIHPNNKILINPVTGHPGLNIDVLRILDNCCGILGKWHEEKPI